MEQNTKCHYVSLCVIEGDSKIFQDDSHAAVRPSRWKTGGESDESGDHGIPLEPAGTINKTKDIHGV